MKMSGFVSLAVLAVALLLGWSYWRRYGKTANAPETATVPSPTRLVRAAFVLSIIIYVCGWIIALFVPDLSWDGNAYHIPAIHQWALKGHICWVGEQSCSTLINGYPKGAELIGFVLVQAFHWSNLVNVTNLIWLPAGVLGIALIALELGASARVSVLGGLLYVLVPVSVFQTAITYVDSAFASSVIAVIAIVVHIVSRLRTGEFSWRSVVALGGALGSAMAIKSPGLLLAVMSVAVVCVSILLSKSKRSFTCRLRIALVSSFVAVVICCAVGGYWYLRNYAHERSPFYPAGVRIGSHQLFPGPSVSRVINEYSNTPVQMRHWSRARQVAYTWCQGLTGWPRSICGFGTRTGGLGFLWLLGCLPAIICLWLRAIRRRPDQRVTVLAAATVIVVVQFLMTPMSWWARYTTWIYALGLPCFAVMLDEALRTPAASSRRIWLHLCILIAIGESAFCFAYMVDGCVFPGCKLHKAALSSILSWRSWKTPYYVSSFPELKNAEFERALGGDGTVALGAPADVCSGYRLSGWISKPIGHRGIVYVTVKSLREDGLERLRREGVEWLIWTKDDYLPAKVTGVKPTVAGDYALFHIQ